MGKAVVIYTLMHTLTIYLCGMVRNTAEGWKHPQKAILPGTIGALLLVVPQIFLLTPTTPKPTDIAVTIGTILSTLWYIITLAQFYDFGFGATFATIIILQIIIGFAAPSIRI
jgi:hypothetical protein